MFDQAVRQPMLLDDTARGDLFVLQQSTVEIKRPLSPQLLPNLRHEEQEEWIFCEVADQGNPLDEC